MNLQPAQPAALQADRLTVRTLAARGKVSTARLFYAGSDCAAAAAAADSGNGTAPPPADFAMRATHAPRCLLLVRGGLVISQTACAGEAVRVGARATPALLRELCALERG